MIRTIRLLLLAAFLSALAIGTGSAIAAEALHFEKSGQGDKIVILVPGMGCSGAVWDGTVADLQKDHTIYTLMLAGFDGTPPLTPTIKAPLCDQWADGIAKLIAHEKLTKPIVCGHSLGGNVALRLAIRHPDAAGAIIVVDGMPIFPPLQPGETIEQRQDQAKAMSQAMKLSTPEQFAAQTKMAATMLITRPQDAETIAAICQRADRDTFIEATRELIGTDLRPDLVKIKVPVVMIAAVAREGEYGQSAAANHAYVDKAYRDVFQGTPQLKLTFIPDSRHFVMYDQPRVFLERLRAELDAIQ